MLAALLASAAGMPFAEYLAAGVLEPLGMHGTALSGPGPGAAAGLSGR